MNPLPLHQAVNELFTIRDFIRWTYSQFNHNEIFFGHGTDNAWDEALALILPSLDLPLDYPDNMLDSRLLTCEKEILIKLIAARINKRVPVAYLTNQAWFCGLPFYVDSNVLIPRSPIGELISNRFVPMLKYKPTRILDLCTGSACIAIACAHAFSECEVDAVDLSPDALNIAEINIENHNLNNRVTPILSDLFTNIPTGIKYDIIVTNPPYVDQEDMDSLPLEFTHEPRMGLEAGDDGLDLVKTILKQAADYLTDDGFLICEVGNSMIHMQEQFERLPLQWLEFENGGHGVFYITRTELVKYFKDNK